MLHPDVHQRRGVLREARSAPSGAGPEELEADALVEPKTKDQISDIGTYGFAQGGHGVDEADLGGQEGIRGVLDGLSSRGISDDHGRTGRAEELRHGGGSPHIC